MNKPRCEQASARRVRCQSLSARLLRSLPGQAAQHLRAATTRIAATPIAVGDAVCPLGSGERIGDTYTDAGVLLLMVIKDDVVNSAEGIFEGDTAAIIGRMRADAIVQAAGNRTS